MSATADTQATHSGDAPGYARRHLLFGWWSLVVFVIPGATLETFHGFKVSWYLDVGEETHLLLWRLTHAHGAFLSLLQIAFALTLHHFEAEQQRWTGIASPCLIGANVALPAGFFLGGLTAQGGDPGMGIFVLPIGAGLLIAALVLSAWGLTSSR